MRGLGGILSTVWLSFGLLSTPPATDAVTPGVAQLDAENVALLRAVRGIAGRIEALRGERFDHGVVAVRTPAELLTLSAELRAYGVLDRERLAARGRAWVDIGFGAAASPEALYVALAGDLDGVGFDPTVNRLLFAPHRLTEEDFAARDFDDPESVLLLTGLRPDGPIVAHMLMHVMQRERTGSDYLAPTTDELMARAAWAEGEANLVAVRYVFSGLELQEDLVDADLDPSEYLDGILVPAAVDAVSGVEVALLRFVYLEGFAQAVERFRKGNWERLERDIARERTTRQILHPGAERLDTAFAEPAAPFPEMTLLDCDVLGEQGVITFVSRMTGKDNLALQAGEGWAGDRLCRWEGASGTVTGWFTHWESADDVADFVYALDRSIRVRYPGQVPRRDAAGNETLVTAKRVLRVERQGREVRLLVASPELGQGWLAESDPPAPE